MITITMAAKIVLALFFVAYAAGTPVALESKVKISLYYESLCPYCQEFIGDQLVPVSKKIGDYMVVDLVPYGNAQRSKASGKWVFQCQHGDDECLGNKIEACVLAKNYTQQKSTDFVGCIEKADNPVEASVVEQCCQAGEIPYEEINSCAGGALGDELLAALGERTDALNPAHEYVPWILVDDVHDEDAENKARDNLLGLVCSRLQVKPQVCNK